jgi:hypothetical protein
LPGSLDPVPEFDPFGFAKGTGESSIICVCQPLARRDSSD